MSKHTPGPWSIETSKGWLNASIRPVVMGRVAPFTIAKVLPTEDGAANASLIAAAPDLLEALQTVVDDWSAQFERNGHLAPGWCRKARAAIAKATREQS